jgi:hypothetical protein
MKKQVTFINLTPHTVNVQSGKEAQTFPPSGRVARVGTSSVIVDVLNGIDIVKTTFGNVEDVPTSGDNIMYIVSRRVKNALPARDDLVVPDGIVRDAVGNQVAGCTRFSL